MKKILSMLLAIMMVVQLLPVSALADTVYSNTVTVTASAQKTKDSENSAYTVARKAIEGKGLFTVQLSTTAKDVPTGEIFAYNLRIANAAAPTYGLMDGDQLRCFDAYEKTTVTLTAPEGIAFMKQVDGIYVECGSTYVVDLGKVQTAGGNVNQQVFARMVDNGTAPTDKTYGNVQVAFQSEVTVSDRELPDVEPETMMIETENVTITSNTQVTNTASNEWNVTKKPVTSDGYLSGYKVDTEKGEITFAYWIEAGKVGSDQKTISGTTSDYTVNGTLNFDTFELTDTMTHPAGFSGKVQVKRASIEAYDGSSVVNTVSKDADKDADWDGKTISTTYYNTVLLDNGIATPAYTRYKVTVVYDLDDFIVPYGGEVIEEHFKQSDVAALTYKTVGPTDIVTKKDSANASYYKQTKPGYLQVSELLGLKDHAGEELEASYNHVYSRLFPGGATFEVYRAEDVADGVVKEGAQPVTKLTVPENSDGTAKTGELAPGSYVVMQTGKPDSTADAAPSYVTVKVEEEQTAKVSFLNQVQYQGIVQIKKVDADGKPLKDVGFRVYTADGQEVTKNVVTTDSRGMATFVLTSADEGTTYVVREVSWPEGYKPAKDKTITVKPREYDDLSQDASEWIVNESNYAALTVNKFGVLDKAGDGRAPIVDYVGAEQAKNFSFTVERSLDAAFADESLKDADYHEVLTLDQASSVSLTVERTNSEGKTWHYRVTENKPANGYDAYYETLTGPQFIDFAAEGKVSGEVSFDDLAKRQIRLTKKAWEMDADGNVNALTDLSGMEFELLRYTEWTGSAEALEATGLHITLGADGHANFTDLPVTDEHGALYYYVLHEVNNTKYEVTANCRTVELNGETYLIPGDFGDKQVNYLEITAENKEKVGKVVFTKMNTADEPLADAEFDVYVRRPGETEYTKLETRMTDANGQIVYNRVPVGTSYKFVEKTAPAGYMMQAQSEAEATVEAAVDEEGDRYVAYAALKNDRLPELTLTKNQLNPSDGKTALAKDGTFTFGVYVKLEDGTFEAVQVDGQALTFTVENGSGSVVIPIPGTYYLKELSTSRKDLLPSTDYYGPYTLTADEVTAATVVNYLNRGAIKLQKTDVKSGAKLAGAVFTLTAEAVDDETAALLEAAGFTRDDETGLYFRQGTTNKNGSLSFTNVPRMRRDNQELIQYTLTEVTAPKGYVPPTYTETVVAGETLKNNQYVTNVKVTNDPQGTIQLQKFIINIWESDMGNPIRKVLEGASFDIYHVTVNEDGTYTADALVSSGVTDKDGRLSFGELNATEKYLVVETGATADPPAGKTFAQAGALVGMTLDAQTISGYCAQVFDLMTAASNTLSGQFDNYDPYAQFKVTKVDEDEKLLDHAKFELYGIPLTVWEELGKPETLTAEQAAQYKLDYLYETGTNYGSSVGTFLTNQHPYEGYVYFLRETEAPDGYTMMGDGWYGPYASAGVEGTETLTKSGLTELTAINKRKEDGESEKIRYVNIIVEKLLVLANGGKMPLAGVTFGVYLADENGELVQTDAGTIRVASMTTGLNESGQHAFGVSTSIKMHELAHNAQTKDYVTITENGEYRANFVLVEGNWPDNVTPEALTYPLTVTTVGGENSTTTTDTTYTGSNAILNYLNEYSSIRIRKFGYPYVEGSTGHAGAQPLAGVVIEVREKGNDATAQQATTGEDGYAYFLLKPHTTYEYRELASVDGYENDNAAWVEFTTPIVGKGQDQAINLYDVAWRRLRIGKTNAGTNEAESGKQFLLKQDDAYVMAKANEPAGKQGRLLLTTGEDGYTDYVEVSREGTYTIEEVGLSGVTQTNFELHNTLSHTFGTEESYTFQVQNAGEGAFTIVKTNKLDGKPVAGMVFRVLRCNFTKSNVNSKRAPGSGYHTELTPATTNEQGLATVTGLIPGWYAVIEQPSEDYVTAAMRYVKVRYDGTSVEAYRDKDLTEGSFANVTTLDIANTPKGYISVSKSFVGAADSQVRFGIYKEGNKGQQIDAFNLTKANNYSCTFKLDPGIYYLKELTDGWLGQYTVKHPELADASAPQWVDTDGWTAKIEVKASNTAEYPVQVSFVNYPITASFTLEKTDDNEPAAPVVGAQFALYYLDADNNKVYYQTDRTWSKETVKRQEWTTMEQPETYTIKLPVDAVKQSDATVLTFDCYLEEVFTPASYVKPAKDTKVTFTYGGENQKVTIVNTTGLYITLTKYGRKYGSTNAENYPLAGATFTLYRVMGSILIEVDKQTTAKDGTLSFNNLTKLNDGTFYAVAETGVPAHYVAGSLTLKQVVGDTLTDVEVVNGLTISGGATLYRVASNTTTALKGYNTPKGSLLILKYNVEDRSNRDTVPLAIRFAVTGEGYNAEAVVAKRTGVTLPGVLWNVEDGLVHTDGTYYSFDYLTDLDPGTYTVTEQRDDQTSNFFFMPEVKSENDPWNPVRTVTVPEDGGTVVATFGNVPVPSTTDLQLDKEVISGAQVQNLQEDWQSISYRLSGFTQQNKPIQLPLKDFVVEDSQVTFKGAKGEATQADYRLRGLTIAPAKYTQSMYYSQISLESIPVTVYGKRVDTGAWERIGGSENIRAGSLTIQFTEESEDLKYCGFQVRYGEWNGTQKSIDPGFQAGNIDLTMEMYQASNAQQAAVKTITNKATATLHYYIEFWGGDSGESFSTAEDQADAAVAKARELPLISLTKSGEVQDTDGAALPDQTQDRTIQPGQQVRYTLTVTNKTTDSTALPLMQPMVIDDIPDLLEVEKSGIQVTAPDGAGTAAIDLNGQQLVVSLSGELKAGEQILITVQAKVRTSGLLADTDTRIQNVAYLTSQKTMPKSQENPNGDVFRDADSGAYPGQTVTVDASGKDYKAIRATHDLNMIQMNRQSVYKLVSADQSGLDNYYDESGFAVANLSRDDDPSKGRIQYKLALVNGEAGSAGAAVSNLYFLDYLPEVGDQRGTAWTPENVRIEGLVVAGESVNYTVKYSTQRYTTMQLQSLDVKNLSGDWTDSSAGAKTFLVMADANVQLPAGQTAVLSFTAQAPKTVEQSAYFNQAVNEGVAGYLANGMELTAASERAKVVIVPGAVSLGNRVWIDKNANGLQDEDEPSYTAGGVKFNLYTSINGKESAAMYRTATTVNGEYTIGGLLPGVIRAGVTNAFDKDGNVDQSAMQGISRYTYQLMVSADQIPAGYAVTKAYAGASKAPNADSSAFGNRELDSNFKRSGTNYVSEVFYLPGDDYSFDLGLVRTRNLSIHKQTDNGKVLTGATFKIYGPYTDEQLAQGVTLKAADLVDTLVTNGNGNVSFISSSEKYLNFYSSYVVVETSSTASYYKADKLTITSDGNVSAANGRVTGEGIQGNNYFILNSKNDDTKSSTDVVTVTNPYEAAGQFVLIGKKEFVGGSLKDTAFTFRLTADADHADPHLTEGFLTDTTDANGDFSFVLKFDQTDAGKEYIYTLTEVAGAEDAGIIYDATNYRFKLSMQDDEKGNVAVTLTNLGQAQPKRVGDKFVYTFVNNAYGTLTLRKQVTGNAAQDKGVRMDFDFTLTVKDKNNKPLTGNYGEVTLDASGKAALTLRADQQVTLSKLPIGAQYTIEETAYGSEGFVTTVDGTQTHTASGTITEVAEHCEVVFVNSRDLGNLSFTKLLAGNTPADAEDVFHFTLRLYERNDLTLQDSYPVTGALTSLVKTGEGTDPQKGAYKEFAFDLSLYQLQAGEGKSLLVRNIPAGTYYEIIEATNTDTMKKGYVPSTSLASGTITANLDGNPNTVVITNTRNTGAVRITKQVSGNNANAVEDFDITLILTPEAGANVVLSKDKADYRAVFSDGAVRDVELTSDGPVRKLHVKLKHNASVTFSNIPAGTTYTVVEDSKYIDNSYLGGKYTVSVTYSDGAAEKHVVAADLEKAALVTVQNTRNAYGGLTIIKQLEDGGFGKDLDFQFKVELSNPNFELSESYDYVKGTETGSLTVEDLSADKHIGTLRFTLKGGESITFTALNPGAEHDTGKGILSGTACTVTEVGTTYEGAFKQVKQLGYTTLVKTSKTAERTADSVYVTTPWEGQTLAVTFTNKRETGNLSVSKHTIGTETGMGSGKDKVEAFEFTLKLTGGPADVDTAQWRKVYTAVKTDKNGVVTYPTLDLSTDAGATFTLKAGETLDIQDILQGVTYELNERSYLSGGYVTSYTVNGGKLVQGLGESGTVGAQQAYSFYNHRFVGNLTVEKTVVVNGEDMGAYKDKEFQFKVVLTRAQTDGVELAGTYRTEGALNSLTFRTEQGETFATFTLKHGQSLKILDIPAGTKYTVTEQNYRGYKDGGFTTTATGDVGMLIQRDETQPDEKTASFVNTRSVGNLYIAKQVQGELGETDRAFTFKVTMWSVTPMTNGVTKQERLADETFQCEGALDTLTLDDNGEALITLKHGESLLIKGIQTGTVYTVEEIVRTTGNVTATSEKEGYRTSTVLEGSTLRVNEENNGAIGDINTDSTDKVTVVNRREGGGLTITKALYGNNTEANKAFEMTLELKGKEPIDLEGLSFPISITGRTAQAKEGTVTVTDGKVTFALMGGQTAVISRLPWGTTAMLTESSDYTDENYTDVNTPQTTGPYTVTYTTQELEIPDGEETSEDARQAAVVTNTRNSYGGLTIGKTLQGNFTEETRDFQFTLTLNNEGFQQDLDKTYDCTLTKLVKGEDGSVTASTEQLPLTVANGTATFTLKGGWSLTIPGILRDTRYTVQETTDDLLLDGYTMTSEGAEGTILEDKGSYAVTYVNTRSTGEVEISKTLAGTGAVNDVHKDKEFAFTMELTRTDKVREALWKNHTYTAYKTVEGTETETSLTFTDGKAQFTLRGNEKLRVTGLLMGTAYTVTEDSYRAEGYFTTANGADSLEAAGSIAPLTTEIGLCSFVNTRMSGDLALNKVFAGNGTEKFTEKDFAFTLRFARETADGVALDGTYSATRITAGGKAPETESVTVENGVAHVTLKGGEQLILHDIPVGTTFTAEEASYLESDGFDSYWVLENQRVNVLPGSLTQDGKTVSITCVNERKVGDLQISKQLTGNDQEWDRDFTFNVTLTPAEAAIATDKDGKQDFTTVKLPVDYTYDALFTDAAGAKTETTITFQNGQASFTLKGGESLLVKGVLEGTGYHVEEVTRQLILDGYIITGEPQTGTITSAEQETVTVINHRDTGSIAVTKALAGNDADPEEAFEMALTLIPQDGVELNGKEFELGIQREGQEAQVSMLTVENNTLHFAIKGGEMATIAHLPTGTGFVLTEADKYQEEDYPNGPYGVDYVYSDHVAEHVVTTGTVNVTVTNTRNAYGALVVSKTLTGNAAEAERLFDFTLTLQNADFQQELDRDYACEVISGTESTPMTLEVRNGKATFQLKGGESLIIPGILRDTLCRVVEDDSIIAEGYEILGGATRYATILEEDGVYTAAYTNYRTTGTLEVTKTLRGNATDGSRDFHFSLTLERTDEVLEELWKDHTYASVLADGTMETPTELTFVDGKADITLKGGQTLRIVGLLKGTTYTVTEDDECFSDGYTTQPDTYTLGDTIGDAETGYTAEFINTRNEGSLTIRKELSGNGGDPERQFAFALHLSHKDGVNISGTYQATLDGAKTTLTVDENGDASFTLADQQKLTVLGILTGTDYTVTEEDCTLDGYATTATGDEGAVTTGDTQVTFDNHREVGSLTVRKVLEGDAADETTQWHFVVNANLPDGRPVEGAFAIEGRRNAHVNFVNGRANITLTGNMAITVTGLLAGTTYRVREVEADEDNYITTVTGGNGTIRYDAISTARFVNTRNVLQAYKSITVEKTWQDRNDREKLRPTQLNVYLFADGEAIAEATISAENGWRCSFENLPVYHADATEITYRVVETATAGYYAQTQYDGDTVRLTNTHKTELFVTIQDTPVPLGAGINMNEGDCFN